MDSLTHHTLKLIGRADAIYIAPILPAGSAQDAIDLGLATAGTKRWHQLGQPLLAVRAEEAPYFSAADAALGKESVGYQIN